MEWDLIPEVQKEAAATLLGTSVRELAVALNMRSNPKTLGDEELLTIAEAAKLLKVNRVTIYRWMKGGYITPIRITPRSYPRYRKSELLMMWGV